MGWIITVIILVIIIIIVISGKKHRKMLMHISRNRPVLSKDEYIQRVVSEGYDPQIISALYDRLKTYVPGQFSMYPEDNLEDLYLIDPEDLESIVAEVHKKTGLVLRPAEEYADLHKKYKNNTTIYFLLDVIHRGIDERWALHK